MYSNGSIYIPDIKPPMGAVRNPHLEINRGLVSDLMMWEGGGLIVEDLSGNGNTGTFEGTAPSWSAGKFGSAIYLPGTNEYIGTSPINPSDVTVSVWIKKTRNGSFERVLFDNDTGGTYLIWGVQSTNQNKLNFNIRRTDGSNHGLLSTTVITDTLWHHWFVTYNGSQGANAICNCYLDGALDNSGALGNGSVAFPSGSDSFDIGRMWYDSSFYYGQFYVDNISVYNRILSASEIALLYQEPFCGFRWTSIIELAAYVAAVGGVPIFRRRRAG